MKRAKSLPITFERAESIGIAAFAYLAEDMRRLGRFLALTGVGPDELRAEAGSPRMLAAVLEYLLGEEAELLSFTANAGVAPDDVTPAWDCLVLEAARRGREA